MFAGWRVLTQHQAADVDRLHEVAEERPLEPSDSPAAQFVADRHAANFGAPNAGLQEGCGDQQTFGAVLQLDRRPIAVAFAAAPVQNISHQHA